MAAGAGYWALVVQTMVSDSFVLVGLFVLQGLPRFGLKARRLHGMFRFSIPLLGAQLLYFVGHNADNVAIGRALGSAALAYYALAFRLQLFPLQLIGSVVNDVSLPVFSRIHDDRQRLESWFLAATRFVTVSAWPMLVLITVAADIAVPMLFGAEWRPAVLPLQLLTLGALTTISRWLLVPLCTSSGRTDIVFGWSVVSAGLLVISFLVTVHWGIGAVAACVGAVGLVTALPSTLHVSHVMNISWSSYMRSHTPAAVGCLVLGGCWRLTAEVLQHHGLEGISVLLVATVVALAGYVISVRTMWPDVFSDSRAMVGLAREPRGVATSTR